MTESNLSEKIINGDVQDFGNAVCDVADVKEAVRILKEEFNKNLDSYPYEELFDDKFIELDRGNYRYKVMEIIDKIFGDKLI